MAFFDDMNRQLTRMGQSAIKKTKDVSESVRISSAIREEENKQDEWFRQMGQYFFENYSDQADGELRVLCSNVMQSKAQILRYNEQLKELKGMIQCPNCGAQIAENSMFCNVCGTKIERNTISPAGKICKNCGATLEQGQRFCIKCGTEVKSENVSELVEEVSEPLVEKCCPNCGYAMSAEQIFCVNCGTKVENKPHVPAEDIYEEDEIENIEEEIVEPKVCPACGNPIEEGAAFCVKCGTKIG